jgi:hypothetical protein
MIKFDQDIMTSFLVDNFNLNKKDAEHFSHECEWILNNVIERSGVYSFVVTEFDSKIALEDVWQIIKNTCCWPLSDAITSVSFLQKMLNKFEKNSIVLEMFENGSFKLDRSIYNSNRKLMFLDIKLNGKKFMWPLKTN